MCGVIATGEESGVRSIDFFLIKKRKKWESRRFSWI